MTTFTVFSDNCPHCLQTAETLRSSIAKRDCGCNVQEVTCNGACGTAKRLGFAGKERPIIVRDETVVHQGSLSEEQATALLPA